MYISFKYQKWVIFVVGVCIALLETASAQERCDLPNNQEGLCVVLNNCPLIKGILQDAPKPLPIQVADYIRSVHCGKINGKNAVCCINPVEGDDQLAGRFDENASAGQIVDIQSHPNLGLLPSTNCGPISTEKLAGANSTDLYEFPWMALLRYETPEGLKYMCGGSIINDRYILTAAHCITRLRTGYKLYSVILGEYDTRTDIDCVSYNDGRQVCYPPRREIFIERIIPHEDYNKPRLSNDLGLLRLNQKISFSEDHIKPICLPKTPELLRFDAKTIIVSGWGRTELQVPSDVLLKAQLTTVDLDRCRSTFRGITFTEKHLCALGPGITDSCKGDSGSPLVFPRNSDGIKFVQFGLVSAGVAGCGIGAARPGIYVRTQKYMDWILDNISS